MSPRILLVNADKRLGLPLGRLLERSGYVFSQAADSAEAQASLSQGVPELIAINLAPAGSDGLELCQAVREHSAWRRVRLLLIGADAGPGAAAQARSMGADAYLELPFRNQRLLAAIGALLERGAP
jgi:DNA-binding response OmpR family regulator